VTLRWNKNGAIAHPANPSSILQFTGREPEKKWEQEQGIVRRRRRPWALSPVRALIWGRARHCQAASWRCLLRWIPDPTRRWLPSSGRNRRQPRDLLPTTKRQWPRCILSHLPGDLCAEPQRVMAKAAAWGLLPGAHWFRWQQIRRWRWGRSLWPLWLGSFLIDLNRRSPSPPSTCCGA
jgi:hypothetical protein